ncbi:peptide/nickel transport system permease protein [Rhizobiales bacterium GAS113]|nr:peptide/nickel transport system permease protein [Rhizobiales bacterium GAS113]
MAGAGQFHIDISEAPRLRRRFLWAARRVGIGLLMLLIVSGLIFAATQALPGDIATMILGKDASAEQIAVLRTQLRLDQPLIVQYGSWLAGIPFGDFGQSIAAKLPVSRLIGPRIVNSFTLVAISMSMALPTSVILGLLAASYKDRWLDRLLLGTSLAVNSLPEFVLALLLVVIFSTNVFHILPAVSILSPEKSILYQTQAVMLPVATLFLLQTTYLYRLVRASVIDVLATDYIQFAELRGLSTRRILFRHALPNAAVPAIQAAATVFAFSVGGVVVIEYAFGFPGIGTALTDAVGNRDIAVVQFIVLLIAVTFFLANMVADIVAAVLTPPGRGDST